MIKIECSAGFNAAIETEEIEKIKEFIQKGNYDYYRTLEHGSAVMFLQEGCKEQPIDVLTCFIEEGDTHSYTTNLIVNGYTTILEITYEDDSKIYFFNEREAWPQTFDEGIDCGDLLFTAEENGYTKEDCFNYIEDYIKIKHDYKFKLNKDKLTIMEGL